MGKDGQTDRRTDGQTVALTVSASIPSSSSSSSSPASPPHPLSASHIHPYHGCPLPPDVATPAATATSGQAPGPCSGLSVDIHGWPQHPTVESLVYPAASSSRSQQPTRTKTRAGPVIRIPPGTGESGSEHRWIHWHLLSGSTVVGSSSSSPSPSLSPCAGDTFYRLGTGCSAFGPPSDEGRR